MLGIRPAKFLRGPFLHRRERERDALLSSSAPAAQKFGWSDGEVITAHVGWDLPARGDLPGLGGDLPEDAAGRRPEGGGETRGLGRKDLHRTR